MAYYTGPSGSSVASSSGTKTNTQKKKDTVTVGATAYNLGTRDIPRTSVTTQPSTSTSHGGVSGTYSDYGVMHGGQTFNYDASPNVTQNSTPTTSTVTPSTNNTTTDGGTAYVQQNIGNGTYQGATTYGLRTPVGTDTYSAENISTYGLPTVSELATNDLYNNGNVMSNDYYAAALDASQGNNIADYTSYLNANYNNAISGADNGGSGSGSGSGTSGTGNSYYSEAIANALTNLANSYSNTSNTSLAETIQKYLADNQSSAQKNADSQLAQIDAIKAANDQANADTLANTLAIIQDLKDNQYTNAENQKLANESAINNYYNTANQNLADSVNARKNSANDVLNNTLNNLLSNYNYSNEQLNSNAEQSLQEAYINKMMNERNLDQYLAAQGINGGGTETSKLALLNNYGTNRNNIERDKASQLAQILNTYNNNVANANNDYSNAISNIEVDKFNASNELENALMGYLVNNNSSYYNNLANADNNYANNASNLYNTSYANAISNNNTYGNQKLNVLDSLNSVLNSGMNTYTNALVNQATNEASNKSNMQKTLLSYALSGNLDESTSNTILKALGLI